MRRLLTVLFLLLGLTGYAQKKHQSGMTRLYVQVIVDSTLTLCNQEDIQFLMTKRHVTLRSLSANIDLKVVDRNVGVSRSWLGVTTDGQYYLMTAYITSTGEYIMMEFRAVNKELEQVKGLPLIKFTNAPICD